MEPNFDGLPDIAVLKSTQDFAALEEEWEDLYHNSPLATPFQSWAWLYSWWEFYGEYYELRLITLRSEGLLVGLVPLMLERWWIFKRLLFVGVGPTSYLDVLAREGWEAQVATAGIKALRQMDSWHVVDLQELHPEAAAWGIFENWTGPRISAWQSNCAVIDAKPPEELLMSLSRNNRKIARRTLRRIEEDGVRHKLVGLDDAEQAARSLVVLSREQWGGHPVTGSEDSELWTRRFEAHLEAAARRMTACRLGGISEFRRGKTAIVSTFLVFGRHFVGAYTVAAGQEALQRYSFSALYIWDAVNIARDRNIACLDLLRGEESYKLRWNPRIVPNYRVILGRSLVFWLPYASYRVLRLKGKRYAGSESTPQWIRSILNRLRRGR